MAVKGIKANEGSGPEIAVDEVSGKDYEVVKVGWGAEGAITLASAANPLPVVLEHASVVVGEVEIHGTPTVSLSAEPFTKWSGTGKVEVTNEPTVKLGATPWSGEPKVILAAGTAEIGTVKITGEPIIKAKPEGTFTVQLSARTSGGNNHYTLLSAASTNLGVVKSSAGTLYAWSISNAQAVPVYVKLYEKATAPVVTENTPVLTLMIPPGGVSNWANPLGKSFGSGIAIGITLKPAKENAEAVELEKVIVNIDYT